MATTPFERGTEVRYLGSLDCLRGEIFVVSGPCRCDRHPCPDRGCEDHDQPHYLLCDPWQRPSADPTTLPPILIHVRHSSLTPYSPRERW